MYDSAGFLVMLGSICAVVAIAAVVVEIFVGNLRDKRLDRLNKAQSARLRAAK